MRAQLASVGFSVNRCSSLFCCHFNRSLRFVSEWAFPYHPLSQREKSGPAKRTFEGPPVSAVKACGSKKYIETSWYSREIRRQFRLLSARESALYTGDPQAQSFFFSIYLFIFSFLRLNYKIGFTAKVIKAGKTLKTQQHDAKWCYIFICISKLH